MIWRRPFDISWLNYSWKTGLRFQYTWTSGRKSCWCFFFASRIIPKWNPQERLSWNWWENKNNKHTQAQSTVHSTRHHYTPKLNDQKKNAKPCPNTDDKKSHAFTPEKACADIPLYFPILSRCCVRNALASQISGSHQGFISKNVVVTRDFWRMLCMWDIQSNDAFDISLGTGRTLFLTSVHLSYKVEKHTAASMLATALPANVSDTSDTVFASKQRSV